MESRYLVTIPDTITLNVSGFIYIYKKLYLNTLLGCTVEYTIRNINMLLKRKKYFVHLKI